MTSISSLLALHEVLVDFHIEGVEALSISRGKRGGATCGG